MLCVANNCQVMYNAYIFANTDKSIDHVEIGASSLDGKKKIKLEDVKEALANYSLIDFQLNQLVGKILTQCDATFTDPIQRKAFKDGIREKFANSFCFFSELMLNEKITETLKQAEEMTDEEFREHLKEHPPVELDQVIGKGK